MNAANIGDIVAQSNTGHQLLNLGRTLGGTIVRYGVVAQVGLACIAAASLAHVMLKNVPVIQVADWINPVGYVLKGKKWVDTQAGKLADRLLPQTLNTPQRKQDLKTALSSVAVLAVAYFAIRPQLQLANILNGHQSTGAWNAAATVLRIPVALTNVGTKIW